MLDKLVRGMLDILAISPSIDSVSATIGMQRPSAIRGAMYEASILVVNHACNMSVEYLQGSATITIQRNVTL